jgi:single-stranded-DNA-specific exonuclease
LQERLNAYCAAQVSPEQLVQKIDLDAELTLPETNAKLLSDMAYLEPFGCENAQPKFYLNNVTLLEQPVLLKEQHVKCSVFADGIIKPVIFFNRPELYQKFIAQQHEPFKLAVTVTENYWNGRTNIEFQGIDVAGLVV